MNEVKELMGLAEHNIKVLEISEEIINKEKVRVITIIGKTVKVKCPICLKYTSSVHDKLKPMQIKYLNPGSDRAGGGSRQFSDRSDGTALRKSFSLVIPPFLLMVPNQDRN